MTGVPLVAQYARTEHIIPEGVLFYVRELFKATFAVNPNLKRRSIPRIKRVDISPCNEGDTDG